MNTNKYLIPLSILIGALFISAAVIYTQTQKDAVVAPATPRTVINVPDVRDTDHIRGSATAKVFLIEYSDTECPFCQRFHTTLNRILTNYGDSVAWVYRHFPIAQLHSKAPKEAEATECVAKLGGEEKFWNYIDIIYERTPANNGLDPALLSTWATEVGVDTQAFETCLSSGTYTQQITEAFNEARSVGAQGTPYTIIVPTTKVSATAIKNLQTLFTSAAVQMQTTPDRLGLVASDGKVALNGALPYEFVEQVIKTLIQ